MANLNLVTAAPFTAARGQRRRHVTLMCVVFVVLASLADADTLSNSCDEQTQTVTLTGSDTAGDGRIWNVRNGKRWNYEGANYEIPLSDKYKGNYELILDRFACSRHFNFYYTRAGGDAVTLAYVEQTATQLETAWTELSTNQGFRSPLNLKVDGRYVHFTDFVRVPVLIFNTIDNKNHGNGTPLINIVPGLPASSRSPHHELFHVIKHGYTTYNPGWLNEGMARWSEKFVAGGGVPCGGLRSYEQITFNFLERDYCDTAQFWEYLGLKYGSAQAGSDGSDVVRAVLEEMGAAATHGDAMRSIERALDRFSDRRSSGYGNAYKEWAKGNYVDDTGRSGVIRAGAPARPRWKEAGEIGTGGDQNVWHDFTFATRTRGTITIAIRASAGDFDGDDDDDDLRFRLDGTLLGTWNSANAFDGAALDGRMRTIHIVQRDVPAGPHTLRLEADEHPVLYSIKVYSGEIPLLRQDSSLFKWCLRPDFQGRMLPWPCFSAAADPPLLSGGFNLPDGFSQTSVLLEGKAASGDQNVTYGFPGDDDDARVLIDGVPIGFFNSEQSLDGDVLTGDLAAVELRRAALAPGNHTIEVVTVGKPFVDHVAVFPTPQYLPLFSLDGGHLSDWSTNYHVISVGAELLPSQEDVLTPANLTIELGTYVWSDEFAPPFYHILLIDASGNLYQSLTGADSHSVTRSITPATLSHLGVGGSVVIVVGARDGSGSYFVKTRR